MVKTYYDPQWFIKDSQTLAKQIPSDFDAILAVARGGLSLAHMLSQALNIRNIHTVTLTSYDDTIQHDEVCIQTLPRLELNKKVLIVEDIVDSGKSMDALMPLLKEQYPAISFEVVALFYKETASFKPDYYANIATEWIDFFWERDTAL